MEWRAAGEDAVVAGSWRWTFGGAQSLETAGALDFLRETMHPFTQRDGDTDETAPG